MHDSVFWNCPKETRIFVPPPLINRGCLWELITPGGEHSNALSPGVRLSSKHPVAMRTKAPCFLVVAPKKKKIESASGNETKVTCLLPLAARLVQVPQSNQQLPGVPHGEFSLVSLG